MPRGRRAIRTISYRIADVAARATRSDATPLFVSGNGRSGTSWIGETLGRADGVIYYREPCHPENNGLAGAAADDVWSRYVPPEGDDPFLATRLEAAFAGRFRRGSGAAAAPATLVPRRRVRVVGKEVAAFMSSEWVARRWRPQVLLILRHPAAYVASVERLGQGEAEGARLRRLLATPPVRTGALAPLRPWLQELRDPLAVTAASWAIRTAVVLDGRRRHPDWYLAFYEDIARDPVACFRELYDRFDLAWGPRQEAWITRKTRAAQSGQFATSRISAQHIDAWRRTLDADRLARIRAVLEPFALPFYDRDEDWRLD
jgi:hypothetical protein